MDFLSADTLPWLDEPQQRMRAAFGAGRLPHSLLLLSVPASIRGDNDPAHQEDTSNGNRFIGNFMGQAPDGSRKPNGLEFEWDSGGQGNCFSPGI